MAVGQFVGVGLGGKKFVHVSSSKKKWKAPWGVDTSESERGTRGARHAKADEKRDSIRG